MSKLLEQAALNNAELCELICSSNGIRGSFHEDYWFSKHNVSNYYPDFVTLKKDIDQQKLNLKLSSYSQPRIWTLKDSFNMLDLLSLNFKVLFDANWITLSRTSSSINSTDAVWRQIETEESLIDWEKAWRHNWRPLQTVLFRSTLLQKSSIAFYAAYKKDEIVAGFIVNQSNGVVGLSNIFTPSTNVQNYWNEAVNIIQKSYPKIPIVGYERGDELVTALTCGFEVIGQLRVWIKE
jgi:hypothetical protein